MADIDQSLKTVQKIDKEISLLTGIVNLLHWDRACLMPSKSAEHRAEQMSLVMVLLHERMTSKELNDAVAFLVKNLGMLDDIQKAVVKRLEWKLSRMNKLPRKHVEEFSKLVGLAEHYWEEAKKNNDYSLFKPYLEKIVAMKIQEAKYIDPNRNPYDVLLEEFERGMTVSQLDKLFVGLKKSIIEILTRVKSSKNYSTSNKLNTLEFPINLQKESSIEMASLILEDKDRFLIAKTVHPFMITIGPDDIRISTAFRNEPFFSFSSTVHESGHALYESNFASEIRNTILADAPSYGIHESQSRIWENQICRGKDFWKYYYPIFQKRFDSLKDTTMEQFYAMINTVKPSFIRIEADELTYCLHIIIRYEIERGLLEGKIAVKDLPKIWNAKYAGYLGITPKNNAEGVLQDVHWSQGNIGYFPTYALGTIYSAMIYSQMKEENPTLEQEIAKGDFTFLKEWLREHIHKHGASMLTPEIIKKATGRELDSKDLIEYFRKKYYEIYHIL